ncbi:hypothetical protein [Rubrivirga sp. IMCC45206]|uniref:hypothetical protein n=1 Tax=Rubrivirga sp. IMCC45206 TaxID=3391614 RepID=UPI00398FA58F
MTQCLRPALVALALLAGCADAPESDAPASIASTVLGAVTVPADSGAMAPRLVLDADGTPVLSWVQPDGDGHALRASRWTGDGWGPAETADAGADWFVNWADTPGVVPTADGLVAHTLVRHPQGDSPYAYDAAVMAGGRRQLLHDDGRAAEHGFVSTAALADGRTAFVWLDGREQTGHHGGGAMTLRTATVANDGTLSDEALLDARTCDCCPTATVATESGLVVAYRDRTEAEVRDVAVVRLVDGAWTEPVVPHADGWTIDACPVNGPALAADGDRVAMAWYTGAEPSRVQSALSTDGGATWTDAVRIDGGMPIGRVGVAFLPNGGAVVSWLEMVGEAAELRLRRLAADGVAGDTQTVATMEAGRASGVPRVVALGDRVLLAWTDAGAGTVRTAVVQP